MVRYDDESGEVAEVTVIDLRQRLLRELQEE